jgi:hypothetical protein
LAGSENFHTVQINEFQFKPSLRIFQRFAGFWHIARALPIYGPAGDITRWIGTNTDIEDQKNTAEALAHLNETLEQRVEERTAELLAAQGALRRFAGRETCLAIVVLWSASAAGSTSCRHRPIHPGHREA